MEQFLVYIAKASCILAIFYGTYYLFLKDETFFKFNRFFLLIGILSAIILPLINIVRYIEVEALSYTITANPGPTSVPATAYGTNMDWFGMFILIYLSGVTVLCINFGIQLGSLYRMSRANTIHKFGGFRYVECDGDMAPFSFFNYIFYNPTQYSKNELSVIVRHEIVHSTQWHTLDVLLAQLVTIIAWINPFSWLYRSGIKQNLEFLADEGAIGKVPSPKIYQYALLKVSGNQYCPSIVNTFYNSLIKKRIVMLNKSKSSKKSILKTMLIVPLLAIFLVAFNSKEVEVPIESGFDGIWVDDSASETIKIVIDKNTTDDELREMKKDLSKKGVDFSYTVVHNSSNEITSLSIDFAAKNNGSQTKGSSSFNNDGMPIDPVLIVYDADSNSISIGNTGGVHMDLHEDDDHSVWIHADDDSMGKTVEIIEKNGKEIIKINGKTVSREIYEDMKEEGDIHKKRITIKKSKHGSDSHVSIWNDDHDDDEEIIKIKEGGGFFFIDSDGDEKPHYIIDGKESTKEAVKNLDPSDIETINVYKGEKASEKFGKKAKDGVVEITTKKKKN